MKRYAFALLAALMSCGVFAGNAAAADAVSVAARTGDIITILVVVIAIALAGIILSSFLKKRR